MPKKLQAWEEGNLCHLARSQHPPKVKYQDFCQNDYYQPQEDHETYDINSEGHLQCHQDPQNIISAPQPPGASWVKGAPYLSQTWLNQGQQCRGPLQLYPNSFDRLGSLKGEYDIKVGPMVLPVQHARRKVPIESKAAIKEAIDYMVKQDILEPQIEPTPWVSSVTYPVKPSGEVRPCLDVSHYSREPQAPDSGRNCSSAGWSSGLHKGRCSQGLPAGTPG